MSRKEPQRRRFGAKISLISPWIIPKVVSSPGKTPPARSLEFNPDAAAMAGLELADSCQPRPFWDSPEIPFFSRNPLGSSVAHSGDAQHVPGPGEHLEHLVAARADQMRVKAGKCELFS